MKPYRLLVVSDVHYAGLAECARLDYEARIIRAPITRRLVRFYRRFVWLRDPFAHNHLLDWFVQESADADLVVANGDYSCDSAFIGVADEAARSSASECLGKLRNATIQGFLAIIGDHELGKKSLVGGAGGLRLKSWSEATGSLGLSPLWRQDVGRHTLVGITSTLVALPVYESEGLEGERSAWQDLRRDHLAGIHAVFSSIPATHRILLFCHDPTALPYLLESEAVRRRLPQFDGTIIGHLHSNWVLRQTRLLAGLPTIACLGPSIQRMSSALSRARLWQPFKVVLCPSLAGLELPKDGGYLRITLDPTGSTPAAIENIHTPRHLRGASIPRAHDGL